MTDYSPITTRARSSPDNGEHAVSATQLGTSGHGSGIYTMSNNPDAPALVVAGSGTLAEFRTPVGVTVAAIAQDGTITVQGSELGGGSTSDGSGSVYPLRAYGFSSVSGDIGTFQTNSTLGSWRVRMYVPAGELAVAAGVFINTVGTVTTGGVNGFALYTDDGQTRIGTTPSDDNLYTVGGWVFKDFDTGLTDNPDGQFVQLLIAINGYSVPPSVPFAQVGGTGTATYSVFSGGYVVLGHRRSAIASLSSFPASFDPATHGTLTEYIPLVALGRSAS